MKTTITARGQTVVPSRIRKHHQIEVGDQLVWLDEGASIRVIPLPSDPIKALRGSGKGKRLTERLLEERAKDRQRGS